MELEALCCRACGCVQAVGDFIAMQRGRVTAQAIETKELNSLVSYVDKEAERQLVEGLAALLPESSFITEEGTVAQTSGLWQWIIDPLDGTTNFLHDLPFFSISVALQHQGRTVLGIVLEVNRKELFYSWAGAPVYCNGQAVKTSERVLADSLLATGFPYYDFSKATAYLQLLQTLFPRTRGIRRLGSAALDLAYVACGRFDGYFEYSLAPWDVAAGAFLVQQAGGIVTDFSGGDNYLHGRQILASNRHNHADLLALIQEHGLA